MQITIDIDAPEPLFAQLIEQIKTAVIAGHIAPGASLPSIRQLANDLDMNHKTVAKAYRLLERDAVIETKGYRGTFIHSQARANSEIDLNALVTEKLQKTVTSLRHSGATDSEIRIAFTDVMKTRKD
ncbi:MAG: GntR family transcriptional regulator [Gammaproteobacteria bacterium]|nr:GntR family transcriptional regulator [Gammaproteobacteria bacterium]